MSDIADYDESASKHDICTLSLAVHQLSRLTSVMFINSVMVLPLARWHCHDAAVVWIADKASGFYMVVTSPCTVMCLNFSSQTSVRGKVLSVYTQGHAQQ